MKKNGPQQESKVAPSCQSQPKLTQFLSERFRMTLSNTNNVPFLCFQDYDDLWRLIHQFFSCYMIMLGLTPRESEKCATFNRLGLTNSGCVSYFSGDKWKILAYRRRPFGGPSYESTLEWVVLNRRRTQSTAAISFSHSWDLFTATAPIKSRIYVILFN